MILVSWAGCGGCAAAFTTTQAGKAAALPGGRIVAGMFSQPYDARTLPSFSGGCAFLFKAAALPGDKISSGFPSWFRDMFAHVAFLVQRRACSFQG